MPARDKKNSLRAKYRRVRARAPRKDEVCAATILTGMIGAVVGVPLALVDGGATLVTSISVFTGAVFLYPDGDPDDLITEFGYKGHFDFDNQRFYLKKNQYTKLCELQKKIDTLGKAFNQASTNARRLKLQRKIQKHVDHQIDILKSTDISTQKPEEKPEEELMPLKVNGSIKRRVGEN